MDNVIVLHNALSKEELAVLIPVLAEEPLVNGVIGEGTIDISIRNANVVYMEYTKYKWLYDKIYSYCHLVNNENFNAVIDDMEQLQYIVYESSSNAFYAPHIDASKYDTRVISFSLHLSNSEDYVGGTLDIQDGDLVKTSDTTAGSITFFRSDLLHEVTPVTVGTRKVIVGWINGKYKDN